MFCDIGIQRPVIWCFRRNSWFFWLSRKDGWTKPWGCWPICDARTRHLWNLSYLSFWVGVQNVAVTGTMTVFHSFPAVSAFSKVESSRTWNWQTPQQSCKAVWFSCARLLIVNHICSAGGNACFCSKPGRAGRRSKSSAALGRKVFTREPLAHFERLVAKHCKAFEGSGS